MTTWIFQGNPNIFDIDAYLKESQGSITWLVRQFEADIKAGDFVYLWKSNESKSGTAGIIAKGIILCHPQIIHDDLVGEFDRGLKSNSDEPRVEIRLLKTANKKQYLKRKWMLEDSILCDLSIIKMASATNFRVTDTQAARLNDLWVRTGVPYSRLELIECLKLYDELSTTSIPQRKGSVVEDLAQKLGRSHTSIYSKLQNYVFLDPRSSKSGYKNGGKSDKKIWKEFFDSSSGNLHINDVDSKQLIFTHSSVSSDKSNEQVDNDEVGRLEKIGLQPLLANYERSKRRGHQTKPSKVKNSSFVRDPLVVAITRLRADYKCEVNGCDHEVFMKPDETPYVEVHHLHQLKDGGPDTIDNTICLCLSHHREIHYGKDCERLENELRKKRSIQYLDDMEVENI